MSGPQWNEVFEDLRPPGEGWPDLERRLRRSEQRARRRRSMGAALAAAALMLVVIWPRGPEAPTLTPVADPTWAVLSGRVDGPPVRVSPDAAGQIAVQAVHVDDRVVFYRIADLDSGGAGSTK